MALNLKMSPVDGIVEKNIVTSMIVSDRALGEISQIFKPEYFQNSFARHIAEWCLSYYAVYKKAPLATIKDIYENEKGYLKEDDAKVIADLLTDISSKYSSQTSFNAAYSIDQAFNYFDFQELRQTIRDAQALLERGDKDKAKEVLLAHSKIVRTTSKIVNPFCETEIESYFSQREDTSEFFKMTGYLGEYMGNMKPGWLIGITAPFKRGKTNFLVEIAANAIMQEKHVYFTSLEMSVQEIKDRIYRRMLNAVEPNDKIITKLHDDYAEFNIPVLDCFRNQNNTCQKPIRQNKCGIRLSDGSLPEWAMDLKYRPCTACLKMKTKDYVAAHWWKQITAPTLDSGITKDKLRKISEYYKHFCRIKAYPQGTAGLNEFKSDLDMLASDGFYTEVMCTDYAEIQAASNRKLTGIEKEDKVWEENARISAEYSMVHFVPTQGNKDSLEAEHVSQKHTSRWVGKLGHVTGMYCLNQMDAEKKEHIMRIACMLHRHKPFEVSQEAYLIQNIAAGQFNLNSAPISFKTSGKKMVQDTGE